MNHLERILTNVFGSTETTTPESISREAFDNGEIYGEIEILAFAEIQDRFDILEGMIGSSDTYVLNREMVIRGVNPAKLLALADDEFHADVLTLLRVGDSTDLHCLK